MPISEVLIDESQRKHITFDAFFANTMFHEVAHGLGIKNTIFTDRQSRWFASQLSQNQASYSKKLKNFAQLRGMINS